MDNGFVSQNKRYLIKWVGRCQYDNHDKIWGWFYYFQHGYSKSSDIQPVCYTFWARTGKAISFKKHDYNRWTLNRIVRQKEDKSYKPITLDHLNEIWPSFYHDIENRFIFFILSDNG